MLFNITKFNDLKNRSNLEFNVLNIGLHVDGKEPADGIRAQVDRTVAALIDAVSGHDMVVDHFELVEPENGDEPFVIVRTVGEVFRGFLWQNIANDFCKRLEQDCFGVVRRKVRQNRSGFVEVYGEQSALVGPKADQWGEFNPEFFTDSPLWINRVGQQILLVVEEGK
jgi:hypothetical protein